ncbi:HalOD1 output domain-containing protein [Natrialbaceae archaeon A-CW2]
MMSGVGVEAVENHQETGTVRTQFDHEKTPASMAVIATLAEVMGADPVELDPLHSTMDPEALDALVRVRNGTTGDIHVSFTHEDHAITVFSYGVVTISKDTNMRMNTRVTREDDF